MKDTISTPIVSDDEAADILEFGYMPDPVCIRGQEPPEHVCERCDGDGYIIIHESYFFSGSQDQWYASEITETCPQCQGQGKL